MRALAAFMLVMGLAVMPALALEPDEILPDRQLEQRARALSAELRCLVCQNQSIDDSNAPLARDLRILVRERLKSGDSDSEVMDFVVARYGEFVLLRPRWSWSTALLWGTPLLVLLAGILGWLAVMRRAGAATMPLTDAEQARLAERLGAHNHSAHR